MPKPRPHWWYSSTSWNSKSTNSTTDVILPILNGLEKKNQISMAWFLSCRRSLACSDFLSDTSCSWTFNFRSSLWKPPVARYSCIRQPPFSFKETSHFMNLMEHVEIVNFRRSVTNSMNAASRSMPSVERSLELKPNLARGENKRL